MTTAELLGRISSHELSEWQALYRLEREEAQVDELASTAQAKLDARR